MLWQFIVANGNEWIWIALNTSSQPYSNILGKYFKGQAKIHLKWDLNFHYELLNGIVIYSNFKPRANLLFQVPNLSFPSALFASFLLSLFSPIQSSSENEEPFKEWSSICKSRSPGYEQEAKHISMSKRHKFLHQCLLYDSKHHAYSYSYTSWEINLLKANLAFLYISHFSSSS